MKILAAICTWNNLNFFKYSLAQALDFCDEVIVVEGCHSRQYPIHSTDGTLDFLASFKHPKLKVLDVDLAGMRAKYNRYDVLQCNIWKKISQSFNAWKNDNWLILWDDDRFWLEDDLPKIYNALETTDMDRVTTKERKFSYNFKFNCLIDGIPDIDRITEECYFKPISTMHYQDGRRYGGKILRLDDIINFHYTAVKVPDRMNARWQMSIEKGTKGSVNRFKDWMEISWKNEKDIFRHKEKLAFILGEKPEDINIYEGKHPAILDNHPWRNVNDVRWLQ